MSKQCLAVLKLLAREGRTVVCTIHQPSASLFETFDHLYVIAEGMCIYQGSTKGMVPYLYEVGLECPPHYNPADFGMNYHHFVLFLILEWCSKLHPIQGIHIGLQIVWKVYRCMSGTDVLELCKQCNFKITGSIL